MAVLEKNFVDMLPGDITTNKEKWFKVIPTKSLFGMMIAGGLGLVPFLILRALGLTIIGIIVIVVMALLGFLMAFKPRDMESNRFRGGGLYPYEYYFLKIKHRKNRKIYVKGYDRLKDGGNGNGSI